MTLDEYDEAFPEPDRAVTGAEVAEAFRILESKMEAGLDDLARRLLIELAAINGRVLDRLRAKGDLQLVAQVGINPLSARPQAAGTGLVDPTNGAPVIEIPNGDGGSLLITGSVHA
jgi:hypothetical protein